MNTATFSRSPAGRGLSRANCAGNFGNAPQHDVAEKSRDRALRMKAAERRGDFFLCGDVYAGDKDLSLQGSLRRRDSTRRNARLYDAPSALRAEAHRKRRRFPASTRTHRSIIVQKCRKRASMASRISIRPGILPERSASAVSLATCSAAARDALERPVMRTNPWIKLSKQTYRAGTPSAASLLAYASPCRVGGRNPPCTRGRQAGLSSSARAAANWSGSRCCVTSSRPK